MFSDQSAVTRAWPMSLTQAIQARSPRYRSGVKTGTGAFERDRRRRLAPWQHTLWIRDLRRGTTIRLTSDTEGSAVTRHKYTPSRPFLKMLPVSARRAPRL